jgi:tRNA (guanine-N7-)-methyltransferase
MQDRTIRSFVRRTGRLTPSQKKALVELWPTYGLEFTSSPTKFDSIFSVRRPVVLEIGFGNGETLVEQALQDSDRNFLGVEVHDPGVGHCLLKAQAAGIVNLRLINHDAIDVLRQQIPEASLARVNLYFPDPWPKKRHHKRRIVQPEFIELVATRLVSGGTLNIATDWANYAEHIDEIISHSVRFKCTQRRKHDGDQPLDRPRTKFERRGLRKGHQIWDWCFKKIR